MQESCKCHWLLKCHHLAKACGDLSWHWELPPSGPLCVLLHLLVASQRFLQEQKKKLRAAVRGISTLFLLWVLPLMPSCWDISASLLRKLEQKLPLKMADQGCWCCHVLTIYSCSFPAYSESRQQSQDLLLYLKMDPHDALLFLCESACPPSVSGQSGLLSCYYRLLPGSDL